MTLPYNGGTVPPPDTIGCQIKSLMLIRVTFSQVVSQWDPMGTPEKIAGCFRSSWSLSRPWSGITMEGRIEILRARGSRHLYQNRIFQTWPLGWHVNSQQVGLCEQDLYKIKPTTLPVRMGWGHMKSHSYLEGLIDGFWRARVSFLQYWVSERLCSGR